MKVCPICQNSFNDSQKFCLNDGMELVETFFNNTSNREQAITCSSLSNFENSSNQEKKHDLSSQTKINSNQNTSLIVGLIIVGIVVIVSVLCTYWLVTHQDNQSVRLSENVNTSKQNELKSSNTIVNSTSVNRVSPSTNSDESIALFNPTPSVIQEINAALIRWKSDAESLNFSNYMNNYAETVDYYRAGISDKNRVSKDKQRAFRLYDNIQIGLKNIHITPYSEGNKATVILDKSWNFKGNGKSTEGEVQQQLTLAKIDSIWYITGEKDLKVYYSQSY